MPVEPIGVRLRRERLEKAAASQVMLDKKILTLDEQIKLLESNIDDDASSNTSDSEEYSEGGTVVARDEGLVVEQDDSGHVLCIKSHISDDIIPPLPKSLLPEPRCKIGPGSGRKPKAKAPPSVKSGLEETVLEMLRNYQPSSSERRPFWCRICRFQGNSIDDFNAHKQSELHIIASKKERKMSYCNLCRKQFTSPEQLKEHLEGAAHKQKLSDVKAKQQSNGKKRKFERI